METKRLTASERESLMRMNIALDILTTEYTALAARAALVPGAKRDLAMMRVKIDKIMEGFILTIPQEQLRTYQNALLMSGYSIGIKRPGGTANNDKEYGMWLPNEVINGLVKGCHDHCMMCDLDKGQRRSCWLRKALDIVPNDVPQHEDGDCPYYTII